MARKNAITNEAVTTLVHIHIVDNDCVSTAAMRQELSGVGYKTSHSDSVQKCLASIQDDRPDLVVIGTALPEKSSLDLARMLAADHETPFIFLTAFAATDIVDEAVSVGELGYIVKPAEISQIVPVIESALTRSRDIKALQDDRDHLTTALESKRDISIAVGLIMERYHFDREAAFDSLRQTARSQRRPLEDIASEMLVCSETLNLQIRKT